MYAHFLFSISNFGSDPRMSEWMTKEELLEKYSQDQFKKPFKELSSGQKGLIRDSATTAEKVQLIGLRHSKYTINKFNKCACMDLVAAALYGYGPFEKGFLNENDSPSIQKKCIEKFLKVRNVLRNLQKEFIAKYKDPIKDPAGNPFTKNLSWAYNASEEEAKQEKDAKDLAVKIWDILNKTDEEIKPIEAPKTVELKKEDSKKEESKGEEIVMVPTVDKNGTSTTYVPAKEVKEEPKLTSVKTEVGVEYNVKPEVNIPQPKVVANPEPQPATETLNVKQKKTLKETSADYKMPNPVPNDPEAIKRATDVVTAAIAPVEAKKEENAYKLSDHIKITDGSTQQPKQHEIPTVEILALKSEAEQEALRNLPTIDEMNKLPYLEVDQSMPTYGLKTLINGNPVLDFKADKLLSFKKDLQSAEQLYPGVSASNGLVKEHFSSFVNMQSIVRGSKMNPQMYKYLNAVISRIFCEKGVLNTIYALSGGVDAPMFHFAGKEGHSLIFVADLPDAKFPNNPYKIQIVYTPGIANNLNVWAFKWDPTSGKYSKVC